MSVSGLRVLRGPDWRGGDTDGGEGHVGTVIELLGNHTVRVLWDMGQESTCSAGYDGKCELRVFDTAQIGVRHPDTRCSDCGDSDICGMLWRCQDCTGCDLCYLCYSDDKHDLRHQFLRIDIPGTDGYPVPKRKTSVKNRSLGLFPGSKVTRGKDWQWGDQDGGQGSEGEVKGYENASPDSVRNLVRVEWPGGDVKTYRHGFYGYVDVTCVEEEEGPFYYRDHLPVLDTDQLTNLSATVDTESQHTAPPTTADDTDNVDHQSSDQDTHPRHTAPPTTANDTENADHQSPDQDTQPRHTGLSDTHDSNNTESMGSNLADDVKDLTVADASVTENKTRSPCDFLEDETQASKNESDDRREAITSADGRPLTCGARVAVRVGMEKLLALQKRCGGDTEDMKAVLGRIGHVTGRSRSEQASVTVRFEACEINLHPHALVTVEELKTGDKVRLREDTQELKALNCRVGWKEAMKKTAGKVGHVLTVDSEGDLLVSFGRHHFLFAPACCTHVPPDTPVDTPVNSLRLGDGVGLAGEQRTGKAGPKEVIKDEDPKALFKRLREAVISEKAGPKMASPTSNPSFSSSSHPGLLFSAAKYGDHETVRQMCTANKSLLEYEMERLTPLMVACGRGQRQVARVLLDCGADANHCIPPRRSPIKAAMESKDEDLVDMLLEHGADPFREDNNRHTYIHVAAYLDLPRVITAMAARGVDVNAKDHEKDTALHIAIEKHCNQAVEALLSNPYIDVSARNRHGFPCVHDACSRGNARALELLLARDQSAVHEILYCTFPLHIAANDDHDDCVRVLVLNGGAEVNVRDTGALYTPLHLACIRAMYRAAEALLELGADIESTDKNGHTPLHLALGGHRTKDPNSPEGQQEKQVRVALASLLVSNGAPVDALDSEGRTPLTYGAPAIREGVESFVRQNQQLVRRKGGAQDSMIGPSDSDQEKGRGQLKEALKGVGLPCGVCAAPKSDVTLQPCQHKCVCSTCSLKVTRCPLCDGEVKDKVYTGQDEQPLDLDKARKLFLQH